MGFFFVYIEFWLLKQWTETSKMLEIGKKLGGKSRPFNKIATEHFLVKILIIIL